VAQLTVPTLPTTRRPGKAEASFSGKSLNGHEDYSVHINFTPLIKLQTVTPGGH
jgi:hypothetical protein